MEAEIKDIKIDLQNNALCCNMRINKDKYMGIISAEIKEDDGELRVSPGYIRVKKVGKDPRPEFMHLREIMDTMEDIRSNKRCMNDFIKQVRQKHIDERNEDG